MKYQNTTDMARKYVAPVVELFQIETGSFLMQSQLEDYNDNPIFGAPLADPTFSVL